ncbi:MAG: aspartate/glutamate racemase family protein [Alphaproteobacteria bacterium]|nr:aspartate/glutamate racemase family protein [Alphaproteobacteria bacterium]
MTKSCVGIVGGLGVGATIHYYEKITAACKARGMVPDLAFVHADVDYGQALIRAGKLDELASYLATFIDRLGRAGADAAVLPAVTPHICIAQLRKRTRLPIINIVDPITAELQARRIKRVALFGTIFTMQGSLWGQLTHAEIVKPQTDEIDFIGKAYQRILDTQKADPDDAAGLRRIAADLQRRDDVETILLAGTDLALMFDEATAGFPAIDVARLHIDAIVGRLI